MTAETPQEGARRLAAAMLTKGYEAAALHCYRDAEGQPVYYRIRLKHPATGDKWIRPMVLQGERFRVGEPPAPEAGKLLYRLPELLAADPALPVVVVEGEGCADALAKLGMTATTSGAADSAKAADWQPMQGRSALLWPDHDPAGAKYADAIAERLRAPGCAVERIDVAALNLAPKGDAVDWLAANPDATAADVLALPRIAPAAVQGFAPEPLRRPMPPPEPYPVAELGPILGPACESLRRVIQAPDAICGAALLAAASLSVQGMADVHLSGRVTPLSLWFLSVAESGERKSAVDAEAMRPIRERERALSADFAKAWEAYEAELTEWEARRDAIKAKGKGAKGTADGMADSLRTLGPAPLPPLRPILTVADFTAEGLTKQLIAGLPSVGAFTDEAALVFGGHGMSKETVMRTAGTLCKFWDNGSADRIRAGEGPAKLWGRRVALHLMGQPVIAERVLSDPLLSGQGFLPRCLLAWPQSTAGTRALSDESLRDDAALIRYWARLADLLARPLPMAEGERNELAPRALHLAPEAVEQWRAVYAAIESNMGAGQRYGSGAMKAWASKAPEQCLRIAGVLMLLEKPDAVEVDAATVERAAELALWHLNEAARLAGTAELAPETRNAEALLAWCHETGRARVYSSEALQYGPACIRDRKSLDAAMAELERTGWAAFVDGGAVMDGRKRAHVWNVLPAGGA